ncbi:hypothetical protein N9875_00550 [bacterium]|jgi:hypothetical protein|nr:hypothetical protein [bacterium]|tara:strand:+ start:57 stop:482 length:426 start_codon:yes stop_codon:yes gene_type:complete
MTASELRDKIKGLAKKVYSDKNKSDDAAVAYDELVKFPELKAVITDLLTADFDKFLESVDWIAPRPSSFRVNLLNGENFVLIFDTRSWIAKVEGKKYYLLNLDEEEMAAKAIGRILSFGGKLETGEGADVDGAEEIETEEA